MKRVVLIVALSLTAAAHGRADEAAAPSSSAPSSSAPSSRWAVQGEDVVVDAQTRLAWTRHDNDGDINWADAKKFCDTLKSARAKWRLPTPEELRTIYVSGADPTVECGRYQTKTFACGVSPLFRLSGPWFWSDAPAAPAPGDGMPRAFDVNLIDGIQHPFGTANSFLGRVLCVRRR